MTARLVTTWGTDDPVLARTLHLIEKETDALLRLELEAALHTFQAAWCLRKVGELREARRTDGHRYRGPYRRGICPSCHRSISVGADECLRPHGPVASRCPGSGLPIVEGIAYPDSETAPPEGYTI